MLGKPLVLVFTVLSLTACGHGSLIKGTVRDSLSGGMLSGAAIVLNDDRAMVSADLLGNFKFDDLAAGTYRIRVSFIGYQTQTIEVVVGENEVKEINVKLVPSSLSLDEVTVIGTHSTEQVMTTISRIDVALRPVKSSQDILRMVPGLVTAQHAGGGKAEQIFLRGFDADHGTD
ncbi:MAG TPA: TonB-dependent receptor, partial [Ohtaekwangia sp.]|nr:TonB-dependent receptor [Ohtaekwangia sp.]